MSESELQREIMKAVSEAGGRVFRNNTGQGWVGAIVRRVDGMVEIDNARPLHAGLCVGSSDLIGWTRDGRFLAIECKANRGKPTEEQNNFIDSVNQAGGIGIVARSVEDVLNAIQR